METLLRESNFQCGLCMTRGVWWKSGQQWNEMNVNSTSSPVGWGWSSWNENATEDAFGINGEWPLAHKFLFYVWLPISQLVKGCNLVVVPSLVLADSACCSHTITELFFEKKRSYHVRFMMQLSKQYLAINVAMLGYLPWRDNIIKCLPMGGALILISAMLHVVKLWKHSCSSKRPQSKTVFTNIKVLFVQF